MSKRYRITATVELTGPRAFVTTASAALQGACYRLDSESTPVLLTTTIERVTEEEGDERLTDAIGFHMVADPYEDDDE